MGARDPRELFSLHESMRALGPKRQSRGRGIALWLVALSLTTALSFALALAAATSGGVRHSVARGAHLAAVAPPFLEGIGSALYRAICPYFSDCEIGPADDLKPLAVEPVAQEIHPSYEVAPADLKLAA